MSAFFLAINRDGSDFDPDLAACMFSQLDCFGIDGQKLIVKDDFAIGYQYFWTVPEEIGECQPLLDEHNGVYLALHGRVDNRVDLLHMLGLQKDAGLSDAMLLLKLYIKLGEGFLEQVTGPFALLVYKPSNNQLIVARDSMGGRHLNYCITDQHVLISTYEMALVAHPSVGYEINESKFVRWLSHIMEPKPSSFIIGLEVLLPGQIMLLDSQAIELRTFYLPNPKNRIVLASDQEYAQQFKYLLRQAVSRRLRSLKPVGTMLSGGMDSVPISILAAQLLADNAQALQAFSWVFDDHPECDERNYSAAVCEDFGIQPHWINCDAVWPQFDQNTHADPSLPFGSEYSEYNQQLLKTAHQQGVGVMLSGIGGDMLYSGTDSILIELLRARRMRDFYAEAMRLFRASNSKVKFVRSLLLGPLLRKFLAKRRRVRFQMPDYLTLQAQQKAFPKKGWLDDMSESSLRPLQYRNVLDGFEGDDAHYGRPMEVKFHIEKRFPFRDRDLVEFMLAIPVDQLYFNRVTRPIVKRAFQGEFRQELIVRQNKTDFTPAIQAGIGRDKRYSGWLNSKDAGWGQIVKQDYILSAEHVDRDANRLRWQLAYHEFWKVVCYNFYVGKLGKNNEQVGD